MMSPNNAHWQMFAHTGQLVTSCGSEWTPLMQAWRWMHNAYTAPVADKCIRCCEGWQVARIAQQSSKLEVHNILHCCQKRTQQWPGPSNGHSNIYRKFCEIWTVIFKICKWTDRETDRHTHHSTLPTYCWQSNNNVPYTVTHAKYVLLQNMTVQNIIHLHQTAEKFSCLNLVIIKLVLSNKYRMQWRYFNISIISIIN